MENVLLTGQGWERAHQELDYHSRHLEVLAVYQKQQPTDQPSYAFLILVDGQVMAIKEVEYPSKEARDEIVDQAILKYSI